MKSNIYNRIISIFISLLIVISSFAVIMINTNAAVLPDHYEDDFESEGKTYENMGILEDQYDLIEPANNRYPVISPNSAIDKSYPPYFIGTYEEVQNEFDKNNMTDGMPVIPPTKIKAEKFMAYSSYGYNDIVASINGRTVRAYQVAANAIMAGCSPEHLPICIAFTEALEDSDYLKSLQDENLTPMMYVNGPIAREIGIDCTQGMTSEEANIAIGRFMELALINLAGIDRENAFGNVQPLVFSENEEACLDIGWDPHHVEQGFDLNDNVITATSFSMWGNNVTPATDLPEEIMKVLAWDITEKNLGGLGSTSIEKNANTKRLIFITESVATALSAKYSSKRNLESALINIARRPLWMRTYAYYYADTDDALLKSFSDIYGQIKAAKEENAKLTASPPWMNGITYSNIETVATMTKGNTSIIVTGDSSRNKTQVMPGGISVSKRVKISDKWNSLVTSLNYSAIEDCNLSEKSQTITPPVSVPSVLSNGDYRILDPDTGASNMTRKGRVYLDSSDNTLYYYAQNATSPSSVSLDPKNDKSFISYLKNLGINSSFKVISGKISAVTIRFPSNAKKLINNTLAFTKDSFDNIDIFVHANNTQNSNAAGGLAKDGATIYMSDTISSFHVNLDGTIVMGDSTNSNFVKLNGDRITIDPSVETGAKTIIGSKNSDSDTYRTMTFVNGGDGTYTITYNTANTIRNDLSVYYLKGTFNEWKSADAFNKTDNDDIISITKELEKGTYEFKIHNFGTDKWIGNNETNITDTTYRSVMKTGGEDENAILVASGGKYEFKYEISTNKLSVFFAENKAMDDQPTVPTSSEKYYYGDANLDKELTISDVTLIQKYLAKFDVNMSKEALLCADANGDGDISIADCTSIQSYLANLPCAEKVGKEIKI